MSERDSGKSSDPRAAEKARLAAALRANLQRRKAQARARAAGQGGAPAPKPAATDKTGEG